MTVKPKTIIVRPDSEVAKLLEQADETPLVLEKNGDRYRLTREVDDIFAGYDPERVREALKKSAGAFAGMDVERLKADLRAQRDQDSIGRPA